MVICVHPEEEKADLLCCQGGLRLVDAGVPLGLIVPADDYLSELFRWYIESAPERQGHRRRRLKTKAR